MKAPDFIPICFSSERSASSVFFFCMHDFILLNKYKQSFTVQ